MIKVERVSDLLRNILNFTHFISLQDLIFSQMLSDLFQSLCDVLVYVYVSFPPPCFPFASSANCMHSPEGRNTLPT